MFSSWLVDTITVQRYGGRTSYGDVLWQPAFTMKARVEPSTQIIRDIDGAERNSTHAISTLEQLSEKDRIWIPGKDTSDPNAALRPISVRSASNKSGTFKFYMTLL